MWGKCVFPECWLFGGKSNCTGYKKISIKFERIVRRRIYLRVMTKEQCNVLKELLLVLLSDLKSSEILNFFHILCSKLNDNQRTIWLEFASFHRSSSMDAVHDFRFRLADEPIQIGAIGARGLDFRRCLRHRPAFLLPLGVRFSPAFEEDKSVTMPVKYKPQDVLV